MQFSRRSKWVAGFVGLGVLLILLVMRPEVIPVDVTVVDPGPLSVSIDEDGVTRFRQHEVIAAPVTGRLLTPALRAGDSASRGQIVARIAPAPLDERAREQAEAALAIAVSARTQAEARARQADVLLEQAQRERSRTERLGAAGALPARSLEDAQSNERLRERDAEAARSAVEAATQYERQARLALLGAVPSSNAGLVPVRTSIAGRVLRVLEEHERVVVAGTPLLEVGKPGDVEVEVDVLSGDAARVTVGTRMIVRMPGVPEREARVTRVEPSAFTKVSPLGVEEQRVNITGRFTEPASGLGDRFRVSVSIVLWSGESILAVPSTSLVPLDEGWGIFVVENGTARLRSVELGHKGTSDVEVVKGINAGTMIVRHPDERLHDGARISAR